MLRKADARGQLIALEGINGPDLVSAAKGLVRYYCVKGASGGISRWDASNIFFELQRSDPSEAGPSARMLVLLYASDLAFRLRWEIRPALEEGQCIIAVPYVETAIAFGKAAGLPRRWLAELFRFAPVPETCYRIKERNSLPLQSSDPADGYLEFCYGALKAHSNLRDPEELCRKFIVYFDALERRRGCQTLPDKIQSSHS